MESNTHTISLQGSWAVLSAALTLALPFSPSNLTLQRKDTHTSLTMQFESEEAVSEYMVSVVVSFKITSLLSRALQHDIGPLELSSNEESRMEIMT